MLYNEVEKISKEVLSIARDRIIMKFPFFSAAIGRLNLFCDHTIETAYLDGDVVRYNPSWLLKEYMMESKFVIRMYLHIVLHLVFMHQYVAVETKKKKWNSSCWDIASDIAVENIILEMQDFDVSMERDIREKEILEVIKNKAGKLTAQRIYRFLMEDEEWTEVAAYKDIFSIDNHSRWNSVDSKKLVVSRKELEKIAGSIKMELEGLAKDIEIWESFDDNLFAVTRSKYSYRKILDSFMAMAEEVSVNAEEFDYVYYTYGLRLYENMPLIEPLEYKEEKKIKELVIAIDTSASCKEELVIGFLRKTYEILTSQESIFQKINIHIIQCDSKVRQDIKITSLDELEEFFVHGKISGFGGTDFRPVFEYVNELKSSGEFENLKGLIYFTDGYGIYPDKMPDYKVLFAFLNEDKFRDRVPGWAMETILEDELYEY